MKMDRNINPDGEGKYALVKLRELRVMSKSDEREAREAITTLRTLGVIEFGCVGNEDEFFVIKLKDRHSTPALAAYANSIQPTDREFAEEVLEMARRSGPRDSLACTGSPWCKEPD